MALSSFQKLSLEDANYELVAAIDFGTTFSGYAFAFKHEPDNIFMNKNWGESLGFQSYKTPTCVLTGPSGEFVAFGHEAQERYSQLLEDSDDDDEEEGDPQGNKYDLYQHFKMILHNREDVSRKSTVISTTGRVAPALDIFSMAIKFLKDHLLQSLGKQTEITPSVDHIRWVLTVPAIWSDESKQFMREAALKAGCISTKDSKMLVIALEPEAASLYCRNHSENSFTVQGSGQSMSFKTKSKYMVVDAGGGTVDITAHQILKNGDVRELYASNGGPWGGTRVDEKFISLLEEVLGKDLLTSYMCRCPQDWLSMLAMFEKAKRAVHPDGKSKLRIQLGWSLAKECKQVKHTTIEKLVGTTDQKSKGISFSNGSLVLNAEATCSLFTDVVEEIAEHIEGMLAQEELREANQVILVGGFGESHMLQKAISARLPADKIILIPPEAQLAVIKGAVLFGFHKQRIKSRIAKRTYGIMVNTPFVNGVHDEKFKVLQHGIFYSSHIFFPFIEKGATLEVGSTVKHTFTLDPYGGQQLVQIAIYSTDQPRQQVYEYVNDPKYTRIGTVMAKCVSVDKPIILMDIEFHFSGTEISVSYSNESNFSQADLALDFL